MKYILEKTGSESEDFRLRWRRPRASAPSAWARTETRGSCLATTPCASSASWNSSSPATCSQVSGSRGGFREGPGAGSGRVLGPAEVTFWPAILLAFGAQVSTHILQVVRCSTRDRDVLSRQLFPRCNSSLFCRRRAHLVSRVSPAARVDAQLGAAVPAQLLPPPARGRHARTGSELSWSVRRYPECTARVRNAREATVHVL